MTEILGSDLLLPLLVVTVLLGWLALAYRRARRRISDLQEEARQREEDYHRQEHRLNQAHRMEAVGILAGSIVHNLNNLLAVIMGHTRMATHELPPGSGAEDELQRVLKAGRMATDLVREISDFYRQADQARKPTDLGPVVRNTVKLLRDILPSTVTVDADLKRCGPVLVTTTGIQQILMNLSSNALHAMHRAQGTITITLTEEVVENWQQAVPQDLGPGSYVRLSVRDDGRGMDPATLDRIFESYFTGPGETKAMGIGLSTVYRLLEDHDGATVVTSRVGHGTTFDMYFPLIAWSVPREAGADQLVPADAEAPQGEAAAPVTLVGGAEEQRPAVAGNGRATVLLVDDEDMVSKVLARGLGRLGFRVLPHTDSREALAAFEADPDGFDVVITDQIMPHMSGVRLTRRIHDLRADIPVVLLTGFRDSFNEQQAREAGVSEFVLKPSSHRDLAELIDRMLLHRRESRD